jgi:hypothetical protein
MLGRYDKKISAGIYRCAPVSTDSVPAVYRGPTKKLKK